MLPSPPATVPSTSTDEGRSAGSSEGPVGTGGERGGKRWVRPVVALCLLPAYAVAGLIATVFLIVAPATLSSPVGVVITAVVLALPGIGLAILAFGRLSRPVTIGVSAAVTVLVLGFTLAMSAYLPPQPPVLAATLDRVTVPAGLTFMRERQTPGSCLDQCPEVTRRYCIADPTGADLDAVIKAFGDVGLPLQRRGDDLIPGPGADRKQHITVDQSQTSNRTECASGKTLLFEAQGRDA